MLLSGFLVHLFNFVHSLFAGPKAPANQWGGLSFEWSDCSSPPHHPHHEPVCSHHPYDFDDVYPPQCPPGQYTLPDPLPPGAKKH